MVWLRVMVIGRPFANDCRRRVGMLKIGLAGFGVKGFAGLQDSITNCMTTELRRLAADQVLAECLESRGAQPYT